MGRLSVVLPAYNEELMVGKTCRVLHEVLSGAGISYELVLVNDGSKDRTWDEILKAGETSTVTAIMKASKKALPGDYVATMEARTPEVNATAQFRIAVKTPMLWGWVGILVIVVAVGGVYYLFRKYGRR